MLSATAVVAAAGPSAFGGPLEVLELLTPIMSVTTLLLSLVSERLWHSLPNSPYFSSLEHCLITLCIILAGAVLAFLMVWTEYQVGKGLGILGVCVWGLHQGVRIAWVCVRMLGCAELLRQHCGGLIASNT